MPLFGPLGLAIGLSVGGLTLMMGTRELGAVGADVERRLARLVDLAAARVASHDDGEADRLGLARSRCGSLPGGEQSARFPLTFPQWRSTEKFALMPPHGCGCGFVTTECC